MSVHPRPAKHGNSEATALTRDLNGERFRLIVEAAPNAIIVTNANGQIELVNKQAEALFRYTREEMLGQQVDMLIPQRFRGNHPKLRDQFMSEPSTRAMGAGRDLYAYTKDGQEVPIEIGLNPIHTEEGMLILSSIIDISERKAAEERSRLQTEQVAAASRYKSEFLANMSHELRTPLNSILILSEQLKKNMLGNLTQKQVTHADIIHRSGSDLLALINDILDLSKIEAGRMSVMLESITITEFVASLERSFRPMAEAKSLGFSVLLESDAPPVIVSDHQRIFQIIRNLFSNALKFTMDGMIRITFSQASSSRGEQGMLAIAVSDTGIGIPADKHEMIFDAFHQVDGSTSRRFGGTGLGLSISRSLAALLGGEICLQSAPGQGSIFTLILPAVLEQAEELTIEDKKLAGAKLRPGGALVLTKSNEDENENKLLDAVSLQLSSPDLDVLPVPLTPLADVVTDEVIQNFSGRNILLVDDDVRNIYAMSSILEELGFDVEIAKNGQQALDILAAHDDIDLVLMDMMMPVMDGYQATQELIFVRQFNKPVIALTAHAMKGDREKCMAAGARDYLAKPITQTELVEMLNKWL